MTEEIVVIDNGTIFESEESSTTAQEAAAEAKLWAEESERQAGYATTSAETAVNAKDDAVSAKEYAEAAITDTNLITVATDLSSTPSNIKTVATNMSNVNDVGGNISNVNAVAGNATNINAVNANKTNIDTVAGDKTNIDKVANKISNVNTVASNINNVNTVASNISDVGTVAGIASDVSVVSANNANITAVANNSSNVNAVAGNSTNINAVAADLTNIDAVAADLTNINNASTYADNAEKWAEGTDSEVTPLGGTHSAKVWAEIAEDAASGVQNPANRDLSNLTDAGEYRFDTQNGTISNCILEIPQNIKASIASNVVTLNVGSIITLTGAAYATYTLTAAQTYTIPNTLTDGRYYLITNSSGVIQAPIAIGDVASGSSLPASGTYFFLTNYNVIYEYDSAWNVTTLAYPFAMIDVTSGVATFVKDSNGNDMIFNGACFVGHHVVVYPKVKGLEPNGINTDGTLKSYPYNQTALALVELTGGVRVIGTNQNNNVAGWSWYHEVDHIEDYDWPYTGDRVYDKSTNIMYALNSSAKRHVTPLIFCGYNGTTVTDFTIRQPYEGARNLLTDELESSNYLVTATGTTAQRTLKDRFADIINVKDFGAKGDGVTDDTAALQTAIDYAIDNQKSLFIPSGTYNCTSLRSKGNFGHNNNMVLKITGDYKTVITLSGSFTIADRLACDFSTITFDGQSTTSATLKFGNYDYYCNRCSFRNIKIYGNPTAIEFVYAFDMGFGDCRIGSHQTYAENVNEMPVVVFSKETNRETAPADQMVFCRCHFEGTAGNGTFIDMEDTYKTYAVSFLGCHFETRNLNSRAFHIKSGFQITFLGCEFINNSYNASSDITDTHTKATNIIEENVDVAFYNCSWDRWNNKLINIDANTKGFKFYGVLSTSPTVDAYPTFSTYFGNATTYLPRWQIRIIQSNKVFYSNEGQELRTSKINFLHPNENSKEGSIEWRSDMGITTKVGDENLTYQKSNIFAPFTTNSMNLGDANHLWKEVFAANATINTSDERQKQNISDIDERVFRVWGKVEFKQFVFKDAFEQKGENARIHFGVIAQRVKEAFESEGLDGFKYGLLCYDEWEDEYEDVEVIDKEAEYDENGEEMSPVVVHTERKLIQKAGNAYGIRYGEALALECAYQRWKLQQMQKQLDKILNKDYSDNGLTL